MRGLPPRSGCGAARGFPRASLEPRAAAYQARALEVNDGEGHVMRPNRETRLDVGGELGVVLEQEAVARVRVDLHPRPAGSGQLAGKCCG